LIKELKWSKYRIVPTTKGVDSILVHVLVDNPNFSDLATLTQQIEKRVLIFINDIENFLTKESS
jgi:hypothetical protein